MTPFFFFKFPIRICLKGCSLAFSCLARATSSIFLLADLLLPLITDEHCCHQRKLSVTLSSVAYQTQKACGGNSLLGFIVQSIFLHFGHTQIFCRCSAIPADFLHIFCNTYRFSAIPAYFLHIFCNTYRFSAYFLQ